MKNTMFNNLQEGLTTAFMDYTTSSSLAYRPEFVYNDYRQGKKVLSSLEEELCNCDEFLISVAFITQSGITPFLMLLKELEHKRIHGKILTTDYLTFSEPHALELLNDFPNIELKMFRTNDETGGFHTKGYIFREDEMYRIIIGSSNMTLNAVTKNREWNTKLVSTAEGQITVDVLGEFQTLWESKNSLPYEQFIDAYREEYLRKQLIKKQQRQAVSEQLVELERYQLKPNKMQVKFIDNLMKLRERGATKALLLSSTGTGKTYAAAFAMRELGFKRVLFLVHRNQIAKQAKKSFQNVFGSSIKMGMLTGKEQDYDADYIFATVQTVSKPENLHRFCRDNFECCIYDEAHHTSAQSYKRVINYFTPTFALGMTATPDKRDDHIEGRNIYEIFDYNIAYEIRLQRAMEENLLCPFHYFAITDLENITDMIAGNARKEKIENFRYLTSDERVNYVMKQAKYYGYSGNRVKGLIFCSRVDEAQELSNKFNQNGWRTTVLTGVNSEKERYNAIERLVQDESEQEHMESLMRIKAGDSRVEEEALDYILSVDIFSEGVDVPEINQVIMLRPTQSPIVFIQQLGRGLRKADGKEYVVVLDFIGNYKNNFMIPIALSGDRTYNKDNVRRYVQEGSRILPGSSTIHFDEISRKRIYESIDKLTTPKKMLVEKYELLKDKLGRIPSVVDFYDYGEIDPLLFINYSGSYHNFLQMVEEDYDIQFSDKEAATIEFISQNIANGKRIYEMLIVKLLLSDIKYINADGIKKELEEKYHVPFNVESFDSALRVLEGKFLNTQIEKKKYMDVEILHKNGGRIYSRLSRYHGNLDGESNSSEYRMQLSDLINLGIKRYQDMYLQGQDSMGFSLYRKYSRKDVCRILNWEKDDSSTVYGYRIKYNTCPIFVTYEKKEDIAESTKYEDQFVSKNVFSWMTRSRVSLQSEEAQKLIHAKDNGLKVLLFIKKSDGEGTDFYYMGQVIPESYRETKIQNDAGKELPIMNFNLKLQNSVRDDLYDYFVG